MNNSSNQGLAFVIGIQDCTITGQTLASVGLYDQIFIVLEDNERKKAIRKIRGEIIHVSGHQFAARVFEDSKDIRVGQMIELTHEPLVLNLGPSMLGQVFDGFLNSYAALLELHGPHLKRGLSVTSFDSTTQTALRKFERGENTHPEINAFSLGNATIDTLYPMAEGGSLCLAGSRQTLRRTIANLVLCHPHIDVVVFALCGARTKETIAFIEALKQQSHNGGATSLFDSSIIIVSTASMPSSMQDLCVLTATKVAEHFQGMGNRVLLIVNDLGHWLNAMDESYGLKESRLTHLFSRAGIRGSQADSLDKPGSLTVVATLAEDHSQLLKIISAKVGCLISLFETTPNEIIKTTLDPHNSHSLYDRKMFSSCDDHGAFDSDRAAQSFRRILTRGQELEDLVMMMPEEDLSIDDYQDLLKARLVQILASDLRFFKNIPKGAPPHLIKLLFMIISHQFQALCKHDLALVFAAFPDLLEKASVSEDEADFLVAHTKLLSMLRAGTLSSGASA